MLYNPNIKYIGRKFYRNTVEKIALNSAKECQNFVDSCNEELKQLDKNKFLLHADITNETERTGYWLNCREVWH